MNEEFAYQLLYDIQNADIRQIVNYINSSRNRFPSSHHDVDIS
jgi:hypothetical protein